MDKYFKIGDIVNGYHIIKKIGQGKYGIAYLGMNIYGEKCVIKQLKKDMLEILNSRKFINFIKKHQNNPKKWIRVRQTNDKTTITVKHILKDNDTNLQQMMEKLNIDLHNPLGD